MENSGVDWYQGCLGPGAPAVSLVTCFLAFPLGWHYLQQDLPCSCRLATSSSQCPSCGLSHSRKKVSTSTGVACSWLCWFNLDHGPIQNWWMSPALEVGGGGTPLKRHVLQVWERVLGEWCRLARCKRWPGCHVVLLIWILCLKSPNGSFHLYAFRKYCLATY